MVSRLRHSFGRINEIIAPPGLVALQMQSYEDFLQRKVHADKRKKIGLQSVFESTFPIYNSDETVGVYFLKYELDEPKFSPEECIQRDLTYESILSGYFKLVCYEDESKGAVKFEKTQRVYLDNMPIMTDKGTFIINGTERVVTSQMHRSPGVLFSSEKDPKKNTMILEAKIVPYRGTWLSFRIDNYGIVNVRIESKRKIPVTTLLYAMGMNQKDILAYYYDIHVCKKSKKSNNWVVPLNIENLRGTALKYDLIDAETKEIIVEKNTVITGNILSKISEKNVNSYLFSSDQLEGFFVADDIIDSVTGIVYIEAGSELNEINISKIIDMGITELPILGINALHGNTCIRDTLVSDKTTNTVSAILEIYSIIRPGENLSPDVAELMFNNMLFNPDYYDLSEVGRVKLNSRLKLNHDLSITNLTKSDILETIRHLVNWKNTQVKGDDIDHLSNRRVRCVGELLENIYQSGILQTERVCKEKLHSFDSTGNSLGLDSLGRHDVVSDGSKDNVISNAQIQSLINFRLVSASMRDFLNSSQLSQFMDQTNPLSEITHKRRVSALGPGGLVRDRAGFEVRDVHPTHYGRICPIETPEGQNIGLINSLACYANINKYGFIETPYCEVVNGKVTDKIRYLTAEEEMHYTISQAVEVNEDGSFKSNIIPCRRGLELSVASSDEIDLMDISNKQSVSVSASLIPFLENDDANRALMGANMQRQAVPIINPQAPLVGTGMESIVAKESLSAIVAKEDGIVQDVDSRRIVIRHLDVLTDDTIGMDVYNLLKFTCSNQNTCINQYPIVKKGQKVKKGDVIADSFSSEKGELALGSNVLVAFMSWRGYNFEDSILISERLVKDDIFTSIHIEEFEILARDTKLGEEEITCDIPSVGENALAYLDENGIIKVGVNVKAGDILVGKVTPKGETQVSPVERLLLTFFNEKSPDVKDTSLRLPIGYAGRVIDVRVFTRHSVKKDQSLIDIEESRIDDLKKNAANEKSVYTEMAKDHIVNILSNQKLSNDFFAMKKGHDIVKGDMKSIFLNDLWSISLENKDVSKSIANLKKHYDDLIAKVDKNLKQQIEKECQGFDLPPGVLKIVKVFIAVKRKIKVGDKMAGRHGNKGVISHILPEQDMPFLEDGTPVDIILNPLGVPSRMNVGQIFETHLGWASYGLGKKVQEMINSTKLREEKASQIKEFVKGIYSKKEYAIVEKMSLNEVLDLADDLKNGFPFATPVFDGAKESDINSTLEKAELNISGQVTLYDGCTGDAFENKITVGYIYMIKLHHLADEKMHARSIGTYSLINQQPLGGKSQFGGQRFGEMEVWALEAYGAAHTLQEMLTVKSDDVAGRTKVYNNIVTGDNNFKPGTPESFNVLVKQMQALCLNVQLTDERGNDENC